MKLEEFRKAHVFTLNRYHFRALQTRQNGVKSHEWNRRVKGHFLGNFSTSQLHNEWKCLSIDAKFMISYESDTD